MPPHAASLCDVVARAATLAERTSRPFAASTDRADAALIARRLGRLRDRVAGGCAVRFARYLQWHGWDGTALEQAFAPIRDAPQRVPEWARVLEELGPASAPPALQRCGGEPFEDALWPFLAVGRRRLRRVVDADGVATAEAATDLERCLIRRLSRIAARTLHAEFGAFRVRRSLRNGGGERVLEHALISALASPRSDYDAFAGDLVSGGWDRLFVEYPVLARLLGQCVLDWITATVEILSRARDDAPELARLFGGDRPLLPIAAVVTDLSDPHHGGRTVSRVTFASGLELVYKPRSLALERAFAALIGSLNDGVAPVALKAAAVLDRGDHGWMETVAPAACASAEEVTRYYYRAGMLLCLAYVLGGSDLHQANLVASGEHPVLIDLEAFIGAPPRLDLTDRIEHDPDGRQVWDSVLRTGLLPVNRLGLRERHHRAGGFVEMDPRDGRQSLQWSRVNTDLMGCQLRSPSPRRHNMPHLAGVPIGPEPHAGAIAGGFEAMSAALQRARRTLADRDGALRLFDGVPTRVVLRNTAAYATLLDRVLHPHLLRDGAEWSAEFEILKASATAGSEQPQAWATWLSEQRALARLDIPLFTAPSNGTSIGADGETLVADYLSEPGHAAALARLAELDDEGTRVQVRCIHLALRPGVESESKSAVPAGGQDAGGANWLVEAAAIAFRLRAAMGAPARSGSRWLGIRGLNGTAQRGLSDVGWSLYGGQCGIALLFAALERAGTVADSEEPLAGRLLSPLVAGAHDGLADEVDRNLGALGAGGVVYALTTAATFLRSEPLLDAAERIAARITPEAIAADDRLDVMSGSSGAALGLLALHRARPRPWVLDRAVLCGRHLLQATNSRRGAPVWRTVAGRVGDGFAHGAAGIAYALACLYRDTGNESFRLIAREALRAGMRRAARAADARPAVPQTRAAEMGRSWCQGTAGTGLARLEVSRLPGCGDLLEGLEDLLNETASAEMLSRSDQVCCGNMGAIELLTRAAQALRESRWGAAARARTARIVARAAQRGSYALSAVDDAFCPGYYQGLSGVGYQLLRLHGGPLPSVLLWE